MIYLVLSVLTSSLLFVIFKLFEIYRVNILQAIVVNYIIAFLFGLGVSNASISLTEIPNQPWFLGAFFLGILFISVFNIMGITSQKNGLSVASVSGKMSVIIPILFGVLVYKESMSLFKFIGIILALTAVYLSSAKSDTKAVKFKNLMFPLLLFTGSGCIDTGLKYVETTYVNQESVPLFLATIFGIAFIFGVFIVILQRIRKKISKFEIKSIFWGIILGVPNYFSMEFLLKALQTEGLESSTLFTINNVSVMIMTTLFALLFFKEKLIKKNWIGVALAIMSILLVASA
ncbi:conserved membrane hypothetical protein [Tenacibaculum maritimum]|uniref:EamA family transporter n=1 Tax=Tenacibaculum maritimum TaxID=107401 RepID=UPI0012E62498|nr:EamA family transporter [Tenacibaculum maritimum]CAA0225949.1 conserved membrane hypothetical protein [Tenacibaculum maritimum]